MEMKTRYKRVREQGKQETRRDTRLKSGNQKENLPKPPGGRWLVYRGNLNTPHDYPTTP